MHVRLQPNFIFMASRDPVKNVYSALSITTKKAKIYG